MKALATAILSFLAASGMSATVGEDLAALRAIAGAEGEAVWPGFGSAPFGLLLVEEARETLLCHPTAPAGFAPDGEDAATGCARMVRPRSDLPDGLLAALPLFGPPSTIVVGTPAATGLAPARWRATILHEHFHQWQAELPEYYARVAALDLAGGDETGMWMLDFRFPYEDEAVGRAFAEASRALARAVAARGGPAFPARLAEYADQRRALAAAAGERNWRYLEFQLWQEGVARWTEIAIGRASRNPELRADAAAREGEVAAALAAPDLAGWRRRAVYALGAGEAMLLEACGPAWRARYPELLALGPLIEDAVRACPTG